MTILDKIIAKKRIEIQVRKQTHPLSILTKMPYFNQATFSLTHALKKTGSTGIIAEHKRKSPSLGWINEHSDVRKVVEGYAKSGAAAISVLTDMDFFGGSFADLQIARKAVELPILRKDFMIDEYQLFEAKAYGADVILLIAECLTTEEVDYLAKFAHNLGLQVLLELHSEDQLEKISDAVDCVGINSRNLKTFEVSIQNGIDLSVKIPNKFIKVAESGISDPKTINILRGYGFQGFLIGEAFMKTNNPAKAIKDFVENING